MMTIMTMAAALAPCQTVTAETKVRIDGRVQRVRKINGRWWSDDNRQLTPAKDGFIWWITSQRGESWTFHHHRPVNLDLAESLHLFMDPASVRNLLGEPNETIGREPAGSRFWMYYAGNGTALRIRFIHDELTDAKYERHDYGVSGRPVQSVAQELGGRSVFKILADRAWQKQSPREYAKHHGRNQSAAATAAPVPAAAVSTDPPQRRIPTELVDSIKVGMPRSEVVRILGEPSGGVRVAGGENDFEVMTYALESHGEISVRLEKGKVVRVSR